MSVVVPTFQRAQTLQRTLAALVALDYPAEVLEIIVVDDGSTDSTPATVAGFPRAQYARQANLGVAAARNHGARLASGEFLLFVDDDILVPPDNLRRHLSVHTEYEECIVAGYAEFEPTVRQTLERSPLGRFRLAAEDFFQSDEAIRWGSDGRVEPLGAPTGNMSLKRDLFWSIGGFDERFPVGAEDQDLCLRARAAGARIVRDYDIRVLHDDQHGDLRALCRREERGAVGTVYLIRKHPELPAPSTIEVNGPIRCTDRPRLIARKLVRQVLSRPIPLAIAHRAATIVQVIRPQGGWPLNSLYRAITGLYVFRGVRQGLLRTSEDIWSAGHTSDSVAADVVKG